MVWLGMGHLCSHGAAVPKAGGQYERFVWGHAGAQVPEVGMGGRENRGEGASRGRSDREDEDIIRQDSGGREQERSWSMASLGGR